MNRWSALAVLLAVAAALALRVPKLDARPLHNDEAVNAVKATELWQHGRYVYDPDEYHGPTLHYATLPFLWMSGARHAGELKDSTLRLAPVVFGVGLILLLPLFFDGLGRHAVAWAALFTAVSPAMVFYSRYFIHEMLLVFFTALTLGAGWRYVQGRRAFLVHDPQGRAGCPQPAASEPNASSLLQRGEDTAPCQRSSIFWAALGGAGVGLMFATKETFVLTIAALMLAGFITVWWTIPGGKRTQCLLTLWNWKHAALAFSTALIVWLLFFSSFFTNFAGLIDSVRTYLPWLKRAGGHSPHIHPWYFYLQRLAWFHPAKGAAWSEGLILLLAVIGAGVSLLGNKSALHKFLALYTIILTALYSVISYKTPWCLLSFYFGMILLAAVGAASLVEFFEGRALRATLLVTLAVLTLHLSFQAWCAGFGRAMRVAQISGRTQVRFPVDWKNPYVYAQTSPDILNVVQRTEGIARVATTGFDTIVKVIAPENDYWPLPWYLRRFRHVGWYERVPDDSFAPIIIVSSKLNAQLDEKSDHKWIMVGLTELRPGKFFEQYVELELWKKYVETLPHDQE